MRLGDYIIAQTGDPALAEKQRAARLIHQEAVKARRRPPHPRLYETVGPGISDRDRDQMEGYGTSEGVEKAWDTRGRGRHTPLKADLRPVRFHLTAAAYARSIIANGLRPGQGQNFSFSQNLVEHSTGRTFYEKSVEDATHWGQTAQKEFEKTLVKKYGFRSVVQARPHYAIVEFKVPKDREEHKDQETLAGFYVQGGIPKKDIVAVHIMDPWSGLPRRTLHAAAKDNSTHGFAVVLFLVHPDGSVEEL